MRRRSIAAKPVATPGRDLLRHARRVVVKVGSALLATPPAGIFAPLARELGELRGDGRAPVLVSSGCIALGLSILGYEKRPREVRCLQAAAAAGQPELMWRWRSALRRHDTAVAQVLLTHADLADRERFLNARRAFSELLTHRVLPIVNENDSVATEEIRVGDNDRLSAHVASLVEADLLIILTSVDGLFTANPEEDPDAERVPVVEHPRAVEALAGGAGQSGLGVGGMRTKVEAARVATSHGIPVVIAHGGRRHILRNLLAGADVGTLFLPVQELPSRKHWIGYTLKPQGRLHVDAGAASALVAKGRSLLPSGLVRVEGAFSRGAMVDIVAPRGDVVARGLAAYGADELVRLAGRKSSEIATILGYIDIPEVVHRDDMVLWGPS